MTFTLNDARAIALEVHARQVDKAGEPDMLHVEAVADGSADFYLDLHVAGMLHDVSEDSFDEIGRKVTIGRTARPRRLRPIAGRYRRGV